MGRIFNSYVTNYQSFSQSLRWDLRQLGQRQLVAFLRGSLKSQEVARMGFPHGFRKPRGKVFQLRKTELQRESRKNQWIALRDNIYRKPMGFYHQI